MFFGFLSLFCVILSTCSTLLFKAALRFLCPAFALVTPPPPSSLLYLTCRGRLFQIESAEPLRGQGRHAVGFRAATSPRVSASVGIRDRWPLVRVGHLCASSASQPFSQGLKTPLCWRSWNRTPLLPFGTYCPRSTMKPWVVISQVITWFSPCPLSRDSACKNVNLQTSS